MSLYQVWHKVKVILEEGQNSLGVRLGQWGHDSGSLSCNFVFNA